MRYYVGQGCGVAVTLLCIVYPLCKTKKVMLILSAIVNAIAVANLLFLDQFGSAVFLNGFAVIHILITLWHFLTERPIPLWEKILFLVGYVGLGLIGAVTAQNPVWALEILPVAAVVPFGISVFVRDEQNTRKIQLINIILWIGYYIAIGSTMVFAQLVSLAATAIALIKYRKKSNLN